MTRYPLPAEIIAARQKANLTQQAAANLAQVDRVSWARYELGDRRMTRAAFEAWQHRAGLREMMFGETVNDLL